MSQVNGKLQKVPAGYKKTEIGVIPNDWLCIESSDAINYFGGYGFSSRLAVSSGIKWLKIANVGLNEIKWDAESFLPVYLTLEHKRFELSLDDVVMALTRPILSNKLKVARIGLDDIPSLLNQRVARLEAKSFHEINFLYYVVQRLNFVSAMNLAMAGTDPPNIGTVALGKIKIATPSNKAEQTAIANALSDVDALITSLEKLIVKKRAIKTAAMQQLLTGKKRLPPFDALNNKNGNPRYKQTELGEIPEDWEVRTIESISLVPIQNGLFYEPSRKGRGVSLINVGDLYKSAPIDINALELFDADKLEISTFRVTDGDLFFTRSSIVPSGIAYCNIYDTADFERDVVFDSHLIRVRVNTEVAEAKYIYLACMSNIARRFLISSAKTATMTTIDQGAIKSCPILLPPKAEQVAIAGVLSDMDKEIAALENRLNKTQQIKQGMMQELLTGRTRLV